MVTMLHKSPWIESACVYLSRSNLVSHLQRVNLGGPENHDIVQDTLNGIEINALGEILAIADEARESRRVSDVGRVEQDIVFETTQAVRTCLAELAEYIFRMAQHAQWDFGVDSSDRTHRMTIIALCCDVLANLDNIGGYLNRQLYTKRKRAESPKQSKARQIRGGKDSTHLDSELEQEAEVSNKTHLNPSAKAPVSMLRETSHPSSWNEMRKSKQWDRTLQRKPRLEIFPKSRRQTRSDKRRYPQPLHRRQSLHCRGGFAVVLCTLSSVRRTLRSSRKT